LEVCRVSGGIGEDEAAHPDTMVGRRVLCPTGPANETRSVRRVTRLVIVGGGNMGAALLGGLLSSGWADAGELAVVEVLAGRRAQLAEEFAGVTVSDQVPHCEAAVIAVKPPDVPVAVQGCVAAGARRVLSIAAGVPIAALEAAAGSGVAVVRAMPNTPARSAAARPQRTATSSGRRRSSVRSARSCACPSSSSTR
jgi:pyrroline-5-carboxylate reductase